MEHPDQAGVVHVSLTPGCSPPPLTYGTEEEEGTVGSQLLQCAHLKQQSTVYIALYNSDQENTWNKILLKLDYW